MAKWFTAQSGDIGIDRTARKLSGVAILTKGTANGDPIDDATLDAIVALGNASTVRARVNHPNRADPAEIEQDLSKLIGQWTNFRRDGDVVRADVQLLSANRTAGDDVLMLAQEAPKLFGVSIVFDDAPPKGPKGANGKPAPARPVALYAADFVDIPASNSAGLFSTKTQEKPMDPLDVYAKDGKFFAMVDGKECAVNLPSEATKPLAKKDDPDDDDDDESDDDSPEAEAKKKAQKKASARKLAATLEQAKTEAVAAERAYRRTFAAIVSSAGLKDGAAAEFEKNFYGRGEADLKFLAQHAIGARAAAVGEGGTHDEAEAQKKATAETEKQTRRFAERRELRKGFGVRTDDPSDPTYQAGLTRYLAAEKSFSKPEMKIVD